MEDIGSITNLGQNSIADFVEWYREKRLVLNPNFQRRSVWTSDGQSYLIDTILRGFPIPKIYIRTTVDLRTQTSIRDVVDGQQRLRAILEFANDQLTLNRRSERFRGKRYSQLPMELQEAFLAYQIGVETMINASDAVVLEVFARLNSYTVSLNGAEKRNARYQTELKWQVVDLSRDLSWFITKYNILTTRRRLRMEDDALCAELVAILLEGVSDGGSSALDSVYNRHKGNLPEADTIVHQTKSVIEWMDENISAALQTHALSRSHQIPILFAAVAHQMFGIPKGKIEDMPARTGLASSSAILDRLSILAEAVETDDDEKRAPYREFVQASSGATIRMSSRGPRFQAFSEAIMS